MPYLLNSATSYFQQCNFKYPNPANLNGIYFTCQLTIYNVLMLSAELLIKCGYLNFIKNAFANEAAAVLWYATCYTQHATCYIINVNIFMRLPPPATDCNCNAACFGNNMQILITVSAVFALKIANIYSTVCRCVCV